MKKIIDGKMYNTETAKLIGKAQNDDFSSNSKWERESLYRKKTGEFFLYGEGGPMSKYAKNYRNNEWVGSSQIIPLSFTAAKKWTEEHLDAEIYEELFGKVTEDDDRRTVGISIAVATHKKAKRQSSMAGISLSEYIENLIAEDFMKSDVDK